MTKLDLTQLTAGAEIMDGYVPDTGSLKKYPDSSQIAFSKAKNIPTESLNVNGKVIADKMETYLSDTGHFQSSTCKSILKSPLHFSYAKDYEHKDLMNKFKKNQGHFDLGNYLHACILEPTKFSRIMTEPTFSRASHDGCDQLIAFWENQVEQVEGIEIPIPMLTAFDTSDKKLPAKKLYIDNLKSLSQFQSMTEEQRTICTIAKSNFDRYENGILHTILKHSKRELSCYVKEPEFGIDVKCRPDAIQFEENIGVNAVISVKTTRRDTVEAFARDAASMDYHFSEGMYQKVISQATGRDFNTTLMIMIQTVAPYGVALLKWSAEDLEIGKYRYRSALSSIKQCLDNDIYPGYEAFGENGIIEFKLPNWVEKELPPMSIV